MLACLLLGQVAGHSYVPERGRPGGSLPVHVHIGSLGGAWTGAAVDALRAWNRAASRSLFTWSTSPDSTFRCGERDGRNDVLRSRSVCGAVRGRQVAWGAAAAIGLTWSSPGTHEHTESDILFNAGEEWSVRDFRRVALHELGHVLGLEHAAGDGPGRGAFLPSGVGDRDAPRRVAIDAVRRLHESTGGGTPDLVVESLRAGDGTLRPRQTFTLSATVRNAGTGGSAPTTLRYYYWQASRRAWVVVGHDGVGSLRAGGRSRESISLRAPASPGRHWYAACAAAVSGERNRRNCSGNLRVTVGGDAAGAPDLVVQSARVDDGTLLAGQVFTFSATVRNIGGGAAAATTLRYYHWRSSTRSWVVVGSDSVRSLAAAASSPESIRLTAPSSAGSHWYAACVASVAGERNRRNCGANVRVTVRAGTGRGRSTADRPDDAAGRQIHVLYVLPRDGRDERLDVNGTIETSMTAVQSWLARQTSRAFRLDTYGGRLDVTFFRLASRDAEVAATGAFVRDHIERELAAAGRLSARKLYLVYYGGRSTYACGGAAWPPALRGSVAALYLHGAPPGVPPCNSNSPGGSATRMGYWEYSAAHELFHLLGAVATCAPNHARRGHVDDDPRDLMYAGSEPWRPQFVDVGRDDYFGHGRACLDLEDSPFLRPARASGLQTAAEPSDRAWRPLDDTR